MKLFYIKYKVIWIVSHCETSSRRENYVTGIFNYFIYVSTLYRNFLR